MKHIPTPYMPWNIWRVFTSGVFSYSMRRKSPVLMISIDGLRPGDVLAHPDDAPSNPEYRRC